MRGWREFAIPRDRRMNDNRLGTARRREAELMRFFKRLGRSIRKRVRRSPDAFLRRVRGVVHVGANTGQERDTYEKFGLDVLWIEPIPDVFQQLKTYLDGYP